MVVHKDLVDPWISFLSFFDIFVYDFNYEILMSHLLSAMQSLLIEFSSDTKYEYMYLVLQQS